MVKTLSRITPVNLLRLQVGAVVVTAIIAVTLFLIMLNLFRSGLEGSSDKTAVAQQSFRIHDELLRSLGILESRADASIEEQPPAARALLRQALLEPSLSSAPVDFKVPLSLREAAVLQTTYDALLRDAQSLSTRDDSAVLSRLIDEVASLQAPLNTYLDDPSGRNFHELYLAVSIVENQARSAIPSLVGAANAEDQQLRETVRVVGFTALALLVVFAGMLVALTAALSRRVQEMYNNAEQERQDLLERTTELRHRNEQLGALYSVFTEITDTLSLRYVVGAALREALKLMQSDNAVLRLLRDGQLVVAGSLTVDGSEVPNLEPVALGEDAVGRAAKRGRSVRVDEENRELLNDRQRQTGIRSGIIIPLIIGARIVGTLGVWSRQPNHFGIEDERILGMMGSQIATAVVAADTTEASEHRAHHDPLTGLPNRLELSSDIGGEFRIMQMEGRPAVVAMVDIDHFKRFNDDFGHSVGDVSLQRVASTMRGAVREKDKIYRYGGEEFVVVFSDTGADEALVVAERVRAAVESTLLTGDQMEPIGPVTISMGLACMPQDGNDFGSLIEMADLAMYRAKSMGRNRIAMWSRDILTADTAA